MQSFAVDGATNLYLAGLNAAGTPLIEMYGANGVTSVYATEPSLAMAMAFDTFGTLYAVESQGTLVKYDHFANRLQVASGLGTIFSMAIEPSGTVYLAHFLGSILTQVTPAGAATTYKVPGVTFPTVVTIDNFGNLFIGDDATQLLTLVDRTTQPYGFGDVPVGTSSMQHYSLVNVGSTSGLTISSISSDSPFVVDPNTTTCVPGTTNLVAGGTCALGFTFTPTAVQSYSGTGQVVIPLPTPYYSATVASLALTGNGVKPAPVANSGGPYTGTSGSPVSFYGSASTDPNNEALTYAWNFGDNTTGTGATPTHTYAAAATYAVTLTVTNSDGATGSATTTATIADTYTATLSPATYSFGNVGVGGSATSVFTLTNTGTGGVVVGTIQLVADTSSSYSATNTCGTGTLAAGQSCMITVTFQPTASGALATTLTVRDSAGTQTATVTGTGVAPTATLTPSAYDFGKVAVGLSQTSVFTLTNTSTISIAVGTIVLAPESTNSYSYTKTCGTTLPAGASCTFTVTFKPTVGSSSSTTLNVGDDAGTQKASITGSGIAPTATLTPSTYNFGNVAAGLSPSAVFTLMNTSATSIAIGTIVLAPESTNSYSYTKTCGATLAANATCTFTVTFEPTAGGSSSTSLNVSDDAGTQKSVITGTALAPTATLTPASYDFGSAGVGVTASKTFILTNTSTVAYSVASVQFTPAAGSADPFSLSTDCGQTLAAGASCNITLLFKPLGPGTFSGTLTAKDSAGAQTSAISGSSPNVVVINVNEAITTTDNVALLLPVVINIQEAIITTDTVATLLPVAISIQEAITTTDIVATLLPVAISIQEAITTTDTVAAVGVQPLTLSPAAYNFGSVAVSSSASTTFTLTNVTAFDSNTGRITVTSSPGAGTPVLAYSLSSNCPAVLAAGSSCTITVVFTPTTNSYPYPAILSVATPSGTLSSTLSGTGLYAASDFSLKSDATTAVMSPTKAAVFHLSMQTSVANEAFPYPIALSYTGTLPAGYTATFTPATVAPGNGLDVVTSELKISYGSKAMLIGPPMQRSRSPLPLACSLFGIAFLARKRLRRGAFGLLLCLGLMAGAAGMSGCGTNNSFEGTITAKGNGMTHTVAVTLYVQP